MWSNGDRSQEWFPEISSETGGKVGAGFDVGSGSLAVMIGFSGSDYGLITVFIVAVKIHLLIIGTVEKKDLFLL
jgi:hypothetical protein